MTVFLEAATRRYIGLSTDIKPRPYEQGGNMLDGEILPSGSSFLESNPVTREIKIYHWTGEDWVLHIPENEQTQLLAGILVEITRLRESFEWVNEHTESEEIPA